MRSLRVERLKDGAAAVTMRTVCLHKSQWGKTLACSCSIVLTWLLSFRLSPTLQLCATCGAGAVSAPPSIEPRTIELRRGLRIPRLGFGTGRPGGSRDPGVTLEQGRKRLVDALNVAIHAGYRLVDTSLSSGMESTVIDGIRKSGVQPSEVVIATKLLQHAHSSPTAVRSSLEDSLRNLKSECIDLYLLQSPRGGMISKVWTQLLALRDAGLIRAVGVSNFGIQQLEGMRMSGLELPEVNQVEVHCWRQMQDLTAYHRNHRIATMGMAPLARGEMFNKTDVANIAHEVGCSEAAIAVRWSMQMGFIPLPRSVRPDRIRENSAAGFTLTECQMERIARVDSNYTSCTKASPCSRLPWAAVAEQIPDKAMWDESKQRKAEAANFRQERRKERARKAMLKMQRQLAAQAEVAAGRRSAKEAG
mmetsp:Transcript_2713/g.6157  ORF Transcript_2713/g.6157 Transcript_2713/m.6157 type:complete len:419 (-) Transcript_2713:37-1293(-)|eukprot:s2742_g9.t1